MIPGVRCGQSSRGWGHLTPSPGIYPSRDPGTSGGGNNETATGTFTADELQNKINDWLAAAMNAGDLDGDWAIAIRTDDDNSQESRTFITQEGLTGAGTGQSYVMFTARIDLLRFLGFESYDPDFNTGIGKLQQIRVGSNPTFELVSDLQPIRIWPYVNGYETLSIGETRGTWFDNQAWLPGPLKRKTIDGEDWGVLAIGDSLYLVKHDSDTSFSNVRFNVSESRRVNLASEALPTIRYDDPSSHIEVRQVVFLSGSMLDVFGRIFASTGTSGFNHATYDDFPEQLACAIPWSLLGDDFTDSLLALEQSTQSNVTLMIEKPTRLEEHLGSELLMRGAWVLWKEGGLQFVQHPTAHSSTVVHTLTEDNKAGEPRANLYSKVRSTDRFIRNIIKLEYNRDIAGRYHSSITLRHHDSIRAHGKRPITIKAMNAFDDWYALESGAVDLFVEVLSNVAVLWALPVNVIERTIDLNSYFSMYPADVASVTDDDVRDPDDGSRGISALPAVVLSVASDIGSEERGMYGRVEMAFAPIQRAAVYCPSANLQPQEYSADDPSSGKSTIEVDLHAFSESGDPVDLSRFSVGDGVTIYERDSLTPTTWDVAIDAISGNSSVTFDSNLSGFDDSGDTSYVMTFQNYDGADIQSDQQAHAFVADDSDGQVNDARHAYHWAAPSDISGFTAGALSDLVERPGTDSGGVLSEKDPVSTWGHFSAVRMANSLANHKTAPGGTLALATAISQAGSPDDYVLRHYFPISIGGPLELQALTRKIYVSPMFKSSGGSEVACRIALTPLPINASSLSSIDLPVVHSKHEFTKTGTTYAFETEVGLDPVHNAPIGLMWLLVELKGNGAQTCDFRAVAWRLGPLE